ncbi:hypothetical protein ACQRUO_37930, partial [Kitasatospora sp. LaBMicrA B282]
QVERSAPSAAPVTVGRPERAAHEPHEDLADVLGDEVAAERDRPEVVDLTPEDDTELLDLAELRRATRDRG